MKTSESETFSNRVKLNISCETSQSYNFEIKFRANFKKLMHKSWKFECLFRQIIQPDTKSVQTTGERSRAFVKLEWRNYVDPGAGFSQLTVELNGK